MNSNSIDSVLSFPTASLRGLLNLLCKTVKTLLVSLSRGTGSEKWHLLTRTQVDQGTVLMLVNVVEILQCRSCWLLLNF